MFQGPLSIVREVSRILSEEFSATGDQILGHSNHIHIIISPSGQKFYLHLTLEDSASRLSLRGYILLQQRKRQRPVHQAPHVIVANQILGVLEYLEGRSLGS